MNNECRRPVVVCVVKKSRRSLEKILEDKLMEQLFTFSRLVVRSQNGATLQVASCNEANNNNKKKKKKKWWRNKKKKETLISLQHVPD